MVEPPGEKFGAFAVAMERLGLSFAPSLLCGRGRVFHLYASQFARV